MKGYTVQALNTVAFCGEAVQFEESEAAVR